MMRPAKFLIISLFSLLLLVFIGTQAASADEFYTVTFERNVGTQSYTFKTQIKYPDTDLLLTTSVPTRDYYNFAGWGLTSNATVADYLPGGNYTDDSSITLYAIWEPMIPLGSIVAPTTINHPAALWVGDVWFSFTVPESGYYHLFTNDQYKKGSGSTSTGIYTYRTDEWGYRFHESVVQDTDLTRKDIELLCYLEADQEYYLLIYGVKEKPLALNVETVEHIITYDRNVGTTSSITNLQIKEPGTDLIISSKAPSRDRYMFLGWSTDPMATVPSYLPGDTYSQDASLALYAVWEGTIDLGTLSDSIIIEHAAPIVTQHIWFKFTVEESGTYYLYTTNQHKAHCSSSATGVYARVPIGEGYYSWEQIGHDQGSVSNEIDITVDLTAGDEYYFEILTSSATSLSVNFFKPNVMIYYDRNTGAQSATYFATQIKFPGREFTIYPNIPNRNYYAFLGWSSSPDATTAQYLPGDPYETDESAILYAVWEPMIDLGDITGPTSIRHAAPPCTGDLWFKFTVSENGYYHFYTTNNHKQYGGSTSTGITTYRYDTYGYRYQDEICRDSNLTTSEVDLLCYLSIDQEYYFNIYTTTNKALVMECVPQHNSTLLISNLRLPFDTATIETEAFANCHFDSVLIPANVQEIQVGAFSECINLKEIAILSKTVTIEPEAFTGLPNDAVIIAPLNSTAYNYAKDNHINFRRLEE